MAVLAELRERPSLPTRISRVANLSYDKCMEILGELEARGLLRRASRDGHDVYGVTEDGYQLVEDWSKLWRRLES
jgi:predicted transcriptional regulator